MSGDFDRRVLEHVTAHPGLTMYEVERGVSATRNGRAIVYALMHLLQDGKVRYRMVPAHCPGGAKHVWYPA